MSNDQLHRDTPANLARRKLLQGVAVVGVASFAPAVIGKTFSNNSESVISGELISNIANPVKTLILRNQSNTSVTVSELTQGAFMFDGSIVDCNTACQVQPIVIPPNQEIRIKFDKRKQSVLTHRADEFRRVTSNETYLNENR